MFDLMTHSTHFNYGYVVLDLIVVKDHSDIEKKETCCHQFMGYSFQLYIYTHIQTHKVRV